MTIIDEFDHPVGRASDEDWCERWPEEGHSYSTTLHKGSPRVHTKTCHGCGYLDVSEVRAGLASLTAERDRLRCERDEAFANGEFWHEQQKLAANVAAGIADLDEEAPALRQMLRTERSRREAAETESDRQGYTLERQRPVIEAARAWAEVVDAIRRMMVTNSRDWAEDRGDAFLWALFLGWDDDDLAVSAMDEVAKRHGWDGAQVARLRRFHAIIDALDGAAATP